MNDAQETPQSNPAGAFATCNRALVDLALIPAGHLSTFVVGSAARGWQHGTSDLDLTVVSREPLSDERAVHLPVPLDPPVVPAVVLGEDDQRWEIKYWTQAQVDQLLGKVSWDSFNDERNARSEISLVEERFLERLITCLPLTGDDWVDEHRKRVEESAFNTIRIAELISRSDKMSQAAVGMLASDDPESAVHCARLAFGYVVDALLMSHGEYNGALKWRVRRFRTVRPAALSFDDYWSVESMRKFDPENPQAWVRSVVKRCQDLVMEIPLDGPPSLDPTVGIDPSG